MAAVEWIEDSDRGGRASEFYPAGEGKRGEIGDKIIVGSGGGGTADETQTSIGEGFAAGVGRDGGEDIGVDRRPRSERGEGGFEVGAALGQAAIAGDVFGEFFKDDLGSDSLDLVEFVMALEEEFGITVPESDLEGVDTVGKAFNLVTAKVS